jgi:hypothetical protein
MGDKINDWDKLLSVAANTQELIKNAVLVGGTAAPLVAGHRISIDADHVLTDLIDNFEKILNDLEMLCGWKTAILKKPVLILGNLDGIATGIRQLIRKQPLETQKISINGKILTITTPEELLRIKSFLILKRNACRDYIDFAALSGFLGSQGIKKSLAKFNAYYDGMSIYASPIKQLIIQLAKPLPYDKKNFDIKEYKFINEQWNDWSKINEQCQNVSILLMHLYGQINLEHLNENYDVKK